MRLPQGRRVGRGERTLDLMGMVGVGPAGPRGGAPRRRPEAAEAARRAAGPAALPCPLLKPAFAIVLWAWYNRGS